MEAQEAADIVRRDYPGIDLSDMRLVFAVHSCIFEASVEGVDFIFKFPVRADYDLAQEVSVLHHFAGKLPFAIPEPVFVGRAGKYIGYKKLVGRSVDVKDAHTLNARSFATQCAEFLYACHSHTSRIDVYDDPAEAYPEYILQYVEGGGVVADFVRQAIDKFMAWPRHVPPQFIYNDLGLNNILFDANGGIAAVLDFGLCAKGDIHREFRHFHHMPAPLLHEVMQAYRRLSGITIDGRLVVLHAFVDMMRYLGQDTESLLQAAEPWMHDEGMIRALSCQL